MEQDRSSELQSLVQSLTRRLRSCGVVSDAEVHTISRLLTTIMSADAHEGSDPHRTAAGDRGAFSLPFPLLAAGPAADPVPPQPLLARPTPGYSLRGAVTVTALCMEVR